MSLPTPLTASSLRSQWANDSTLTGKSPLECVTYQAGLDNGVPPKEQWPVSEWPNNESGFEAASAWYVEQYS